MSYKPGKTGNNYEKLMQDHAYSTLEWFELHNRYETPQSHC